MLWKLKIFRVKYKGQNSYVVTLILRSSKLFLRKLKNYLIILWRIKLTLYGNC